MCHLLLSNLSSFNCHSTDVWHVFDFNDVWLKINVFWSFSSKFFKCFQIYPPHYKTTLLVTNNKCWLLNMSQAWVKSWWMYPYTFGEYIHHTPYHMMHIASKQRTVDTINRSLMKKATTIQTTHPSWELYRKMSSQCNHKSSPNNVTNCLSSLFSILSNFRQDEIIA